MASVQPSFRMGKLTYVSWLDKLTGIHDVANRFWICVPVFEGYGRDTRLDFTRSDDCSPLSPTGLRRRDGASFCGLLLGDGYESLICRDDTVYLRFAR